VVFGVSVMRRLFWSPEAEDALLKLWPRYLDGAVSVDDLLAVFVGRSFDSLVAKAKGMGLRTVRVDQINTEILSALLSKKVKKI